VNLPAVIPGFHPFNDQLAANGLGRKHRHGDFQQPVTACGMGMLGVRPLGRRLPVQEESGGEDDSQRPQGAEIGMVGRVKEDPAAVQQLNISSQFRLPVGVEKPAMCTFELQRAAGKQRGMHRAGRD
jgi:hypothetical protein